MWGPNHPPDRARQSRANHHRAPGGRRPEAYLVPAERFDKFVRYPPLLQRDLSPLGEGAEPCRQEPQRSPRRRRHAGHHGQQQHVRTWRAPRQLAEHEVDCS